MEWVIPGQLLRSPRPGRSGDGDVPARREAVADWLAEARDHGVRAVICLLGPEELCLYGCLPEGLLGTYRAAGLEVEHVAVEDAQWPPLLSPHVEQVWQAYQRLPRPVVVHCSAGLWRTGHAIEAILTRLEREGR